MFKKLKNLYEEVETTNLPSAVEVVDGFSINNGSKPSVDSIPSTVPPDVSQRTMDSLISEYEQSCKSIEDYKIRLIAISDRQGRIEEYISGLHLGYQGKQKEIEILRAKNLSLTQSLDKLTKDSKDSAMEHIYELETHLSAYKKIMAEAEMAHVVHRNELADKLASSRSQLTELVVKWRNNRQDFLQLGSHVGSVRSSISGRLSDINSRLNALGSHFNGLKVMFDKNANIMRDNSVNYERLKERTSHTVTDLETRLCALGSAAKSKFESLEQLEYKIQRNYSRLRQHFVVELKKRTDLIKDQETQMIMASTAVRETIERSNSAISSLEDKLAQKDSQIAHLNSELATLRESNYLDKFTIADLCNQLEAVRRENEAFVGRNGVDVGVQTESTKSVNKDDDLERIRCLLECKCGIGGGDLCEVLETELRRREEEKMRLDEDYGAFMERMESSLQPYLPLVMDNGRNQREDRLIGGLNDLLADIAIYREFFDGNTVRRTEKDSYDHRFRDIIGRMVNPSSKVTNFINSLCEANGQVLALLERFVESGSIGSLHSATLVGSLKSLGVQFGELTSLSESYCAMTCVSIEGIKLEYFRHVLYKYMTGCDRRTLARVICSIVAFPHNKLRAINKYHNL